MKKPPYSLEELAAYLGAELIIKNAQYKDIDSLGALSSAKPNQISFFSDSKYQTALYSCQAGAVMLKAQDAASCPTNALVMDNPYLGFAKVARLFDDRPKLDAGIHPSAVIGKHVSFAEGVAIGPNVVIGEKVTLGKGTTIEAGAIIADGVSIGEDTEIRSRAVLCHGVDIGSRCIIHPGAVIGGDGFGLAMDEGRWVKIPQLGSVRIGDDVEVGANTTIDRGAIEDTIIEHGVRIDNQVQIAHNVRVGAHTAMAAKVGVAGSTTIGQYCLLAGDVGISGHLNIGNKVTIMAKTGVSNSIEEEGVYGSGMPARKVNEWRRNIARIMRLDKLSEKVKTLEKKVSQLEKE